MSSKKLFLCIVYLLCLYLVNAENTQSTPDKNLIPELYPEVYTGLTAEPSELIDYEELPRDFNWCAYPEGGCTPNWNQHISNYGLYYPYCYLHATLSMVNDRIRHKLHGKGVPDVVVSRQDVLDCANSVGLGDNEIENGGESVDVLEYIHRFGIPDDTCNVWSGVAKKTCDMEARCQNCMTGLLGDSNDHCWAVKNYVKYGVESYGFVRGEHQMMSEIIQNGPITCSLAVDDHFVYNYTNGIYQDKNNVTDLDHDVEVVGWTEQIQDDGTFLKAWIVRNSWGSYFGTNSFFLLERGVNSLRLEEKCVFANVDVSELEAHLNGHTVGSMFGLIKPGEKPQSKPDNWDSLPHNFTANPREAADLASARAADEYIKVHVPQPPLELRGSIVSRSSDENVDDGEDKTVKQDEDKTVEDGNHETTDRDEHTHNKPTKMNKTGKVEEKKNKKSSLKKESERSPVVTSILDTSNVFVMIVAVIIAAVAVYFCFFFKTTHDYEAIPSSD